jgi:hypothetical protein
MVDVKVTVTHKPGKASPSSLKQLEKMLAKYEWEASDYIILGCAFVRKILFHKSYGIDVTGRSLISLEDNRVRWNWPTGSFMLAVFPSSGEAKEYFQNRFPSCIVYDLPEPEDNPFYDKAHQNPAFDDSMDLLYEEWEAKNPTNPLKEEIQVGTTKLFLENGAIVAIETDYAEDIKILRGKGFSIKS